MSFDLEGLKIELSKYGDIIDCSLYLEDTNLEIKCKNKTGRATTYKRIETELILPYFNEIVSNFGSGFYKGGSF